MDWKAASILALLSVLSLPSLAVEKDWASIVLALKPKQGQNFEQDLALSKAFFSLERRLEAIKVLGPYAERGEERARKQLNLISSQFYSQETANAYYEAVRLIGTFKWAEAHEKLEQALGKEAGNSLVLTRLIQVEFVLKQREPFFEHLKLAESLYLDSNEFKLYSAYGYFLMGDEKDSLRGANRLLSLKSLAFTNPVSSVWYLEVAKKMKRSADITAIQGRVLKDHRSWPHLIDWFLRSGMLSPKEFRAYQDQQDKTLKDPARFQQNLEAESKRTQYFWVGYYSYATLTEPIRLPEKTAN